MSFKSYIYKYFVPSFVKRYRREKKQRMRFVKAVTYNVVSNQHLENNTSIYKIKDFTWEKVCMPEVYSLVKSFTTFLSSESAHIYELSDVVLVERYNMLLIPQTKQMLHDQTFRPNAIHQAFFPLEVLEYSVVDRTFIFEDISNALQYVDNDTPVLSLLGQHDDTWTHFITQYFPKLLYAERAGLLDAPIIVMIPQYNDGNILELWESICHRHSMIVPMVVSKDTKYIHCKKLYYVPFVSYQMKHSVGIQIYDYVIPKINFDIVCDYFKDYIYRNKQKYSPCSHKLLYLRRGNTLHKKDILNANEIEEYFQQQGFYFVETDKLSIIEKINLFANAEIIVGPVGASFTNVIFCQQRVKILGFVPSRRAHSTYSPFFFTQVAENVIYIAGTDIENDDHSNYILSKEDVVNAYNELIK